MGILTKIKAWLVRSFTRDPEEAYRKAEIRKLQTFLADLSPPYYQPKQNLVLPGFAEAISQFYALIRPLAELARSTIANSDIRVSQSYFDYLISSRLPAEEQERKQLFMYDAMSERIKATLRPEEELEALVREFRTFLGSLDALGPRVVNAELYEVERFIDLCGYDYERIVGLFDPSANLDNPHFKPEFEPVPGAQLLPELMDFYYLTESFVFSPQIKDNLLRLLEKRQPDIVDGAKKDKIDKLYSSIEKTLNGKLSQGVLLALMRVIKEDPAFAPSTPRERKNFIDVYRKRLIAQFEKDHERILHEQRDHAITQEIKTLFGDAEILEIAGYNEENDTFLRRETPNGFLWVKPLRILRTFIASEFEPHLKEAIKRILVEGYFDNKGFQNNLANILYQCERSGGRIVDFEEQINGTGRHSIMAMNRYIEEMRKGKEISSFLSRIIDVMNKKAREIVEDETSLFAMLGETLGKLLSDFKRSSPDLITNFHTLGGGRNKEIFSHLQRGYERIQGLLKIMRNFAFVKGSADEPATEIPDATLDADSSPEPSPPKKAESAEGL
jgi:hypothetical protein